MLLRLRTPQLPPLSHSANGCSTCSLAVSWGDQPPAPAGPLHGLSSARLASLPKPPQHLSQHPAPAPRLTSARWARPSPPATSTELPGACEWPPLQPHPQAHPPWAGNSAPLGCRQSLHSDQGQGLIPQGPVSRG